MKVILIGAGTITAKHAAGLKKIPEVKVTAVCDLNRSAAEKIAAETGGLVYTEYNDALQKTDADSALVCLPHGLHCEAGLAALNSGRHLFMEKPLANTAGECLKLLKAAKKNKRKIFTGHTHQYRSVVMKARELIDKGELGQVRMIMTEVIAYYNWETRKPWFLDPKLSGGGALFNTAPHQADHLLYLGGAVRRVFGAVESLRPGQSIDSDSIAMVEYKNGARGLLVTLQGTKMEEPARLKVRVLGDKGSLQFNPFGNELEIAHLDKMDKIITEDTDPMTAEWIEFISSIKENRPARTGGEYGLKVVELLEAFRDSSCKHGFVELKNR
ncbi:MAG TPA: hypothetical protein DC049_16795 [Spirochaetia bacterium]|nr:hypothetical protein [Spirochaetia bacterium]